MDATTNMVQETWSIGNWVFPLISGALGALIGTYCGSYFLFWKQEKKIRNVRLMAIKALNIFSEYATQRKSYADAASEFNTKLNVSEKRAVVVALHKLGVPFETPVKDDLDIKNIRLKDVVIDKDEIITMKTQTEKGNCDNQFFTDIESYFTSNLRLNAIRSVGKKYVEEVHAKSYIDKKEPGTIVNPDDWFKSFTPGEFQTILVLRQRLSNTYYFSSDGRADPLKIKGLIREIEIGLWDSYLFWEYESYKNVLSQRTLADAIQTVVANQQQQAPKYASI